MHRLGLHGKVLGILNRARNKDNWLWEKENDTINPIQDGPLWGCTKLGGEGRKVPLSICLTYLTMIKLGSYILLKENPKKIWITWHTPWVQ